MKQTIAKIISILFHPVFLTPFLVSSFLYSDSSLLLQGNEKKILLLFIFIVFTVLLPILSVFLFAKTKIISGVELTNQKERSLPYLSCTLYYGALFQLLFGLSIPLVYSGIALAGCCLLLFLFLINLKWKISAHTAGAGTGLGIILYYLFINDNQNLALILFVPACIIAGLIGFSRLELKQHSNAEVYSGYLLGIVVSLASLFIYNSSILYFYLQ